MISIKTILKRTFNYIFLLCFCSVCTYAQISDTIEIGVFASPKPKVFKQNTFYKQEALRLVDIYADSIGFEKSVLNDLTINDFATDVKYMINNPNRTLLNFTGNYCGSIVVINWLLNNRPDIYTRLVFELAIHGYVQTENEKKIKVPKKMTELSIHPIDSLPGNRNLIDSTSISDFILGVSMVYTKKKFQRMGLIFRKAIYDKDSKANFIFGNSAPWEMDNYIKLAGLQVEKKRYYLGCRNNIKTLNFLQEQLNKGALPIVFENHLLTATKSKRWYYKITGAHFITIHGIETFENTETLDLSYWDYGAVSNRREIHPKHSPYSAKNFKKLIKKADEYSNYEIRGNIKNMNFDTFYKGVKGYWIIQNQN